MTTNTWREVRAELDFDEGDEAAIAEHRARMDDEVRAFRLAEVRKAQALSQRDVARVMGVSQPRVGKIEHGDLEHTELATLRAYVRALGGKVEITATFGDHSVKIA